MEERIKAHLDELIMRYPNLATCKDDIEKAYKIMEECYASDHKLLIAGNGGSAADAEHIAGELMKRFKTARPVPTDFAKRLVEIDEDRGPGLAKNLERGLMAIPLVAHEALTTAYINDVDGLGVFAQQLYGFGRPGDVFLGISTSGNSKNVMSATVVARAIGIKVIGLTGVSGGELAKVADVTIRVPETETYKVQELHLPVYHCLCLMLEDRFFGVETRKQETEQMLYKYISVPSLALILKNRTIRFNALNLMDDLQEQETGDLKNVGQFCFVSCWTEDAEEQIPMWKMYTDLDSGVRIKLPKYPFYEVESKFVDIAEILLKNSDPSTVCEISGNGIKSLISVGEMLQNGFFAAEFAKQDTILHKVEYTSDREKLYPKIFKQSGTSATLEFSKLGKYKNEGWAFQKEWRYIILLLPLNFCPFGGIDKTLKNSLKITSDIIDGSATLPFSHYDIPIRDDAFSQMEIMLSPKISAGNRLIVHDLVQKYNPNASNASIVESKFQGTLA